MPPAEALGMKLVGRLQDALPLEPKAFRLTEMDRGRGHQAQAGVMMLVAVPLFKAAHPGLRVR